jgi:hypothetical protein
LKNLLNAMLTFTGQTLDGSRTITGSAKETLASCKEPEETVPGVGPIVTNSKGFRISAAFQVC